MWVTCWDLIESIKSLSPTTDSDKIARKLFAWIDGGTGNSDGIAIRARLANWRLQPFLKDMSEATIAEQHGKDKQSYDRFAQELYTLFPLLRP